MNLEFIFLSPYTSYILTAFTFAILSCLLLYLKTRKEFKKYEKMFLAQAKKIEFEEIKSKKETEATSGSFVY